MTSLYHVPGGGYYDRPISSTVNALGQRVYHVGTTIRGANDMNDMMAKFKRNYRNKLASGEVGNGKAVDVSAFSFENPLAARSAAAAELADSFALPDDDAGTEYDAASTPAQETPGVVQQAPNAPKGAENVQSLKDMELEYAAKTAMKKLKMGSPVSEYEMEKLKKYNLKKGVPDPFRSDMMAIRNATLNNYLHQNAKTSTVNTFEHGSQNQNPVVYSQNPSAPRSAEQPGFIRYKPVKRRSVPAWPSQEVR